MVTLTNKVVIITGASSGIGRACALEFARKGAAVVLAARRIEKLAALHEEISSFNKKCLHIQTDVTMEDQVVNLFERARERFGKIDILVNNAGRGLKSEITHISLDEWTSVLWTNLTSVFICSREALKKMIPQKSGHIITIGSIAGLYGTPNYAAYCAAKHGVTGFQRSLKWENRKHGIRVSTVFPGRVDTEFFDVYPQKPSRSQMLSAKDLASYIVCIAERRPLKRHALRLLNIGKRIGNLMGFIQYQN
ncbi:SDR family oxidoreductase [candidate division KSB1 bacterium]|nr:SDR family oxidoreductase [candidate division KSB1 bacterium]RQW08937.1 MAG: SDR family oxidoreductase [candidate division KSB1 bacterium]